MRRDPGAERIRPERIPEFVCPHCGERVKKDASSCPHCGSDEQTGWSAEAETAYLDPSFDREDYDQAAEREFGRPSPRSSFFWILPAVSAILIVLWIVRTLL